MGGPVLMVYGTLEKREVKDSEKIVSDTVLRLFGPGGMISFLVIVCDSGDSMKTAGSHVKFGFGAKAITLSMPTGRRSLSLPIEHGKKPMI